MIVLAEPVELPGEEKKQKTIKRLNARYLTKYRGFKIFVAEQPGSIPARFGREVCAAHGQETWLRSKSQERNVANLQHANRNGWPFALSRGTLRRDVVRGANLRNVAGHFSAQGRGE
jgi:hypothetical protein